MKTNVKSEPDKLRDLLKPYLQSVADVNSKRLVDRTEGNHKRLNNGDMPNLYPVSLIVPSFNDLLNWTQKSGYYEYLKTREKP